jgi:hypothetical protein
VTDADVPGRLHHPHLVAPLFPVVPVVEFETSATGRSSEARPESLDATRRRTSVSWCSTASARDGSRVRCTRVARIPPVLVPFGSGLEISRFYASDLRASSC